MLPALATYFCEVLLSVRKRTPSRLARTWVLPFKGLVFGMKTISTELREVGASPHRHNSRPQRTTHLARGHCWGRPPGPTRNSKSNGSHLKEVGTTWSRK